MISFHNQKKSFTLEHPKEIQGWISNSIESYDRTPAELNFIFMSDDDLLKVNQEHLNHDYYTDVITFDYCVEDMVSGDIYISVDRVIDNAKDYDEDPGREMCRVMIHGILHLLGFEDKTAEKQKEMRNEEEKLLNLCPIL